MTSGKTSDLISRLIIDQSNQWNCHFLAGDDAPVADGYATVTLRSVRVSSSSHFTHHFSALLFTNVALLRADSTSVDTSSTSTVTALRNADPALPSHLVNLNKRLFGPWPYVGGPVSLHMGLFCFEDLDMTPQMLDVIESISRDSPESPLHNGVGNAPPTSVALQSLINRHSDASLKLGVSMTLPG